ncbi:portal protein [Methylobacterium marchantiae]|uniref:Portal protein n=1 Tax=Methylobacterium marchantiae TaxID=600331 RepID=A0ABW3X4C7_9HYPH|nr:hypothetical protein AIGOOFII_3497 [Methylobacterium marchantiae]
MGQDLDQPREEAGPEEHDDEMEGRGQYTLGEPAKAVYDALTTNRESVNEMGRRMAELTIPSVFPPQGYRAGDDLPGNNQSAGAQCVNTLASKLMFMAFPPGQPIAKLEPVLANLQEKIDQDPDLYANVLLALSQLEMEHRRRFQSTALETTYTGHMKLLLVAGNSLWKHLRLNAPTFHRSDTYVVSRDRTGHPHVTIHQEKVRVATLPEDIQDLIYRQTPDLLKQEVEWTREVEIHSVCMLVVEGDDKDDDDRHWLYWQEYEGHLLEGTEFEADYEDCPMWPSWLIPVYGENWGRSYCEEYRGDLYSVEVNASALNDGSALAAWALTFVKPGARTSIRQVQKAKNLDILPGSAEDVTVFRSDKTADLNFVQNTFNMAARRLGAAFLLDSATRRDGERVTAEEVTRTGRELDMGMGGLYTQVSQSDQRRIIMRAMRLHEVENKKLPKLPKGVVEVNVVTGTDAMGRSGEAANLEEFAGTLSKLFGPQGATALLKAGNFATRLAAAKGIKPDGLVKTDQEQGAEQTKAKQEALQQSLLEKAAGPVAGAVAGNLAGGAPPPTEPENPA